MTPFNFEDGFFDNPKEKNSDLGSGSNGSGGGSSFFDKPKGFSEFFDKLNNKDSNKGGEHDCEKCSPDIKKMCEETNMKDRFKNPHSKAEKIAPEIDKMTSEFLFKVFTEGAKSYNAFVKNGMNTPKGYNFNDYEGGWQKEMMTMFYRFTKMILDK